MKTPTACILLLLAAALPMVSAGGLKGAKRAEQRVLKEDDKDGGTGGDNPDDAPDQINVEDILGIGCFSEDATVRVEHRDAPVMMKDLQLGDRVLTKDNDYAPVYAFGHRLPSKKDVFVQLETGHPRGNLQMTAEHLVFVQGKPDPVRADSVRAGDVLQTTEEDAGARVVATSLQIRQGVYAPFTTKGTIVVNGIAASSYVSLQESEMVRLENGVTLMSQHKGVHMSLSPLRLACQGVSSRFCQPDEATGMPRYVSAMVAFQRYSESHLHVCVQMVLLLAWMIVTGACMAVETVFGASAAPTVVALLAGLYLTARALNIRVRCKVVFPNRRN